MRIRKEDYRTVEHGIGYNEGKDTYYVNAGNFKLYSFPNLQDARKFRDELNAARLKKKTEEALARLYEKDGKEIKEEVPYPFNALEAMGMPNADYRKFEEFLTECRSQEAECLYLYYHDGNTLNEIAKQKGVTRERIRQLVAKAMHKIRVRYVLLPQELELKEQRERLEADLRALNEYRGQLVQLFKEKGVYTQEMEIEFGKVTSKTRQDVLKAELEEPIEELNLSIRSANCLRRAGIDTIADLVSHSYDEMRTVRNLGKKSLKEIEGKLKERGYAFRNESSSTII